MVDEREALAPGPRHRARVELWKRAVRGGQVTQTEVRECAPDHDERALLAGCLRAAGVSIVEAPRSQPVPEASSP